MQGEATGMLARNHFATRIRAAYARTLEGIFEIGKTLLEAKAELPHGSFLAMVKADLPFGPRQAERYLAIARNPALAANATLKTHFALPAEVTTLYQLSLLEPDELSAALREMARTKQKFGDDTDIAKILIKKDIKRLLGRPAVTFQGVMAEVGKIAAEANATPPPPPPPAETSQVNVPPAPKIVAIKDGAVAFPDKARRLAVPGMSDAEILPAPPNPPHISPEEREAWGATMAECGRMIADYADRQAENQRIDKELSERFPLSSETQQGLAAADEIIDLLRAVEAKFTHAAVPPLFEHRYGEAIDLARKVLRHLAGLVEARHD